MAEANLPTPTHAFIPLRSYDGDLFVSTYCMKAITFVHKVPAPLDGMMVAAFE